MPRQSQEPPAPVSYPWPCHLCSAQLSLGGGGGGMSEVLGASQLMPQCTPSTPCLFAAGCGDTEDGDLKDEGYYVYLDEDELPEVLGGAARCQDTYQDWISLYCWAPFHATLMTTPEGSRCHWDQISRFMLNTSPTARGLSPPGRVRCPPGWLWLWPWGSAASYPSQLPLCSAEPQRGLTPQPLPVPMPVRSQQLAPSFPALGTEGWARGAGDRAEQW
ncbi:uncharacterized protein LOC134168777 isoform X4 [Pezoporus occidentalis]|uniref:uncharacterized protein LOC134168777 isoform X4 n=1 Tax=Pezoporus occidentalis TaxID=407982 RepID=UPI002F917A0F